jgi:hypothetical protein
MTPKKEALVAKRLSDLPEEEQRRMLDTRVTDRNVRNGILKGEELEAAIRNLPDLAAQAVPTSIPCPSIGGRED